MSTTRIQLGERIIVYLNGGRIPVGSKVDYREIQQQVTSVANKHLKISYMSENIPLGESVPNGLAIAEYNNIPVTKYNNVSCSILPAMPIKLPLNLGVWAIFPTGDPSAAFIPLQQGDEAYLKSQPVINKLLGFIGFTQYGTRVVYSIDISLGTPTVTMRLVVLDMTQYGDNDILPITSDQEWDIFSEIVKMYGVEPPSNRIVDPGSKDITGAPPVQQVMP